MQHHPFHFAYALINTLIYKQFHHRSPGHLLQSPAFHITASPDRFQAKSLNKSPYALYPV
ncbi:hypothetical protein AF332_03545 [Sporosarcina globispora]|uniref:Uncharacterized protein n=1 Tax=Sporosarcina globispora TaxID=1459 RepID=A0A0M0G892_SPOGL|nr:hypothetical protein AF332_03545 [Sporosarcina globispora]